MMKSGTPRTSCGAIPACAEKIFGTRRSLQAWMETLDSMRTRLISCYNCPMTCGATHIASGQADIHDEMLLEADLYDGGLFGPGVRGRVHRSKCRRSMALTRSHTPQVMAFALELYENGILTDDDFPGMPADNEGRFYWLLSTALCGGKVLAMSWPTGPDSGGQSDRQGCRSICAYIRLKNTSSCRSSCPCSIRIDFSMHATGEKMNITQIEGQFPQAPFPAREQREEFVNRLDRGAR